MYLNIIFKNQMNSEVGDPGNLLLKSTNFFSSLFFSWIQPVIKYGAKNIIQQQNVPNLQERMRSTSEFKKLHDYFEQQLNREDKNKQGMSLVKAMFSSTKHLIVPILITALISVSISMSIPYITSIIIQYIQQGVKQISKGILFVGGILILKFIQNLSESRLYYNMTVIGYNLCNNLSIAIFDKATKYPTLCSKKYTVAQLINYSQVDAQRLTNMGYYTTAVLFVPIQLAVGIFLMYNFIGISFLAGMGIILLMGVVVFLMNKKLTKANDVLLKAKDKRMKITNQIFNQIRFIKANAWEKYFFNKLNRARKDELSKLKKTNMFQVMSILFLWITAPLILSSIFGVHIARGNKLTAETAFTTIILFNILQFPLRMLPQSISQLNQIWTSLKRIQKFLKQTEIDRSYISQHQHQSNNALTIKNGTFYWQTQEKKQEQKGKDDNKDTKNKKQSSKQSFVSKDSLSISSSIFSESEAETQIKKSLLSQSGYLQDKILTVPHIKALKNINIQIQRGKLTIILGNIGSGKSSLLYSVVGQMKPFPESDAKVEVDGSIALVVQKAWMLSKSIQENILMTQERDNTRFNQAIKFSCLEQDLKQFPDAQKTIIGQKGLNLSGGQKARVNLARAIYSDNDVFLLDDIISAVDVHVGNTIMKDCILGHLKSKTRVLVTHAISYAKYADQIIIMKKGQIVERGTYQQVKNKNYFKQIQQINDAPSSTETTSTATIIPQKIVPKTEVLGDILVQTTTTNKIVEDLLMPEDRIRGEVSLKVYKTYLNLNGGWIFLIVVTFLMASWITLSTLANIQIERWCQNPGESNDNLYYFIAFSIGSAFFAFGRALVLVFSGIRQGGIAHKKMIKGLIYASIPEFYDRVPIGRILNRVSKDLKELDQNIGYSVGGAYVNAFGLLGNLVICVYASTPYILIPIAIFLLVCIYFKNYYMRSQREVIRLQTVTSSPIVSSFTQVMNGLPTIRSYDLQQKFVERQCEIVDVNKKNRICKQALETWFSLRLAWLSYIVNITAMAYCIIGANDNPSLAGLLFAYSFTIDDYVIGLVYSLANVETKMVSVQRIANFMSIQPEKGYLQYTKKWRPRDQQPLKLVTNGQVQFKDLSLRYRQNLPNVLDQLNFVIRPGEKIGIVGRTGAGKSTFIQALLRTVEPTIGQILIDGMDITAIPLKSLRSNLTLIAQQPILIAGTLRQNLDPRNQHSDQKLIWSLQRCYVYDIFKERQLLDTQISESGQNLSIGQKQLICIARAILRQNKLVLIDQATANIDIKSDKLIQETIRTQFSQSTVITIAHRIKTVLHSDRILVMEKGKIKEFDTPDNLLQRKGIFYEMYQKSQQDNKL